MILRNAKIIVFILTLTSVTCFVNAQDLAQAKEAYNNGVELVNQDKLEEAMKSFLKCVEICDILDNEESVETKMAATGVIPGLQLKIAGQLVENDDYEGGIAALEKTIEYAKEYNDDATAEKATGLISKTYFKYGSVLIKNNKMNEALACFDKTIELEPDFATPYMFKGIIYKQMDDPEKTKENLLKSIEVAQKNNDRKTENAATSIGWKYFYKRAADELGKQNYAGCAENAKSALEFSSDNPDIMILLVQSYNKEAKYDEAIEVAKKALEVIGADKKPGFFYEMAFAYQAKGENDAACENYKNAMTGQYLDNAKYQIEHILKCAN